MSWVPQSGQTRRGKSLANKFAFAADLKSFVAVLVASIALFTLTIALAPCNAQGLMWTRFTSPLNDYTVMLPRDARLEKEPGAKEANRLAWHSTLKGTSFTIDSAKPYEGTKEEYEKSWIENWKQTLARQCLEEGTLVKFSVVPVHGSSWDGEQLIYSVNGKERGSIIRALSNKKPVSYEIVTTLVSTDPIVRRFIESFSIITEPAPAPTAVDTTQSPIKRAIFDLLWKSAIIFLVILAMRGPMIQAIKSSKPPVAKTEADAGTGSDPGSAAEPKGETGSEQSPKDPK
jgi:hypothetical protein